MIGDSGSDGRSGLERLMDAGRIVVHHVERNGCGVSELNRFAVMIFVVAS